MQGHGDAFAMQYNSSHCSVDSEIEDPENDELDVCFVALTY